MGGHSTKITRERVVDIISESIFKFTQNCKSDISGTNEIDVTGNNNIIDNVNQTIKVSLDINCINSLLNSADASNKLTDSVVQGLKDNGVALTQFADSGKNVSEDNLELLLKM